MKKFIPIVAVCMVVLATVSSFTTPYISPGAEIAVIINNDNPVTALTASEVKLYFLRKLKKRWPEINKNIRPADRKNNCPEQETFYSKILAMSANDVEKYFIDRQYQNAEKPQDKFASDKEIIDFVASEPGAIGYVNANSLTAEAKAKVKIVLTVNN